MPRFEKGKGGRKRSVTLQQLRTILVKDETNGASEMLTGYRKLGSTEEAKAAVRAWVEERMEWVASRGQTIGEAKVTVYPGPVPAKKERVVQGTFIPVTAPAKGEN